ncbi:MAG: cupin domain-containing protein [Microbacteriaceae bacterium]
MHSELGPRLRRAREARGLSLRGVAAAVGVSASMLSQVETGKTQPSVSTLYALVGHLDVSLDDLMGNNASGGRVRSEREQPMATGRSASPDIIQRAADNPVIDMQNGVRWERLAVGGGSLVDPLITIYQPGAGSSADGRLMRHSGVEYGYLLSGELTLEIDSETYVLGAGDSLCFDSSRPHRYINNTAEPATGLWLVVGRQEQGPAGDPHGPDRSGAASVRPGRQA